METGSIPRGMKKVARSSRSDLFYRVLDSFGFHRVLLPNRIRFKKVRFQGASRFWKVQTSNMLSVLFPEFVLHSVHSTWPHTFLTLALVHFEFDAASVHTGVV